MENTEAIRTRQWSFMPSYVSNIEYDAYHFTRFVASHPSDKIKWADDKKKFFLLDCHLRGRLPQFAKDQIQILQQLFYQNTMSLVIFAGLNKESQSSPIHKDGMDVFYIQVHGNITWQIYTDDEQTVLFETKMVPGDAMWVPRGIKHQVLQDQPRVGYSFGCEGKPEPSTYI